MSEILTEIKTKEAETLDWIKRHLTVIILIAIFITGIIIFNTIKSDRQGNLNILYTKMTEKEDSVKSLVDLKYTGMPVDYIAYEEEKAVKTLETNLDYKNLQTQAQDITNAKNSIAIFPFILLGLLGFVVVTLFAGVTLYTTTKVNFTQKLIEGNPDAFKLLMTIIKAYTYIWITTMVIYGIMTFVK